MVERTPAELKKFYMEQAQVLLTLANQMDANTQTVRTFFIGIWACGRPSDVNFLEEFITVISEPDWEFEGWLRLSYLLDQTTD